MMMVFLLSLLSWWARVDRERPGKTPAGGPLQTGEETLQRGGMESLEKIAHFIRLSSEGVPR